MAIYVYTNQRDGGIAHIPSHQEFVDLKSIMDWLNLWARSNYLSKLHMPYAWRRTYTNSNVVDKDSYWFYWSSSPYGSAYPKNARYLSLESTQASSGWYDYRSYAMSVRLFLDEYIEPDNTRTVEAWTLWSAWIFHNADLWVISVTNGTDKSITMYDKNVGATTVYNSWDTLVKANMWRFFQWWNYYWFPATWTISNTSSTAVNTTWYGGDNPYSSSTFIITTNSWSDPTNDNLRTDSWENYFVLS
jgi:hypothetical protein